MSVQRPWTVEQEREALLLVLHDASLSDPKVDVPTAMWGAARALINLREGCHPRPHPQVDTVKNATSGGTR
jgi:hypothetical protein